MNQDSPIPSNDLPDELHPCEHMTNLVSRRSDGSLNGPAKWYTDFHVMTCPHCKSALKGLRQLHVEVDKLKSQDAVAVKLNENQWGRVEAEWDLADQR